MIDLNDYYYFVHVVDKSGFAQAGRALDVPKSRLSRHVGQLETRLGVRLIQRTSRQFTVTDVGKKFYKHACALLEDMEVAEAAVKRQTNVLSGRVRLSCSVGMAQFVLFDMIPRFLTDHPKIDIIQQVTNQPVDLVENGIDIAVRAHIDPLPDSNLIQQRLALAEWHLFAAPDYLDGAGHPTAPSDLRGHACLKLGWKPEQGLWSLYKDNVKASAISFIPRLSSDDLGTLKQAARDGLGIVALPSYTCRPDIAASALVRVLPDWTAGTAEISLLMPSRQGVMPAVQALSKWLKQNMPLAVTI